MEKIAVFPGSFDPITKGHVSIVIRAIPLFDKIIVAIGKNSVKQGYFDIEKRIEWIKYAFKNNPTVSATVFEGLTVDFCEKMSATHILRGIRNSADFEYEKNIAQMNRSIQPALETIFLLTTPELTHIHSSLIREIHRYGGDIAQFIPDGISLK